MRAIRTTMPMPARPRLGEAVAGRHADEERHERGDAGDDDAVPGVEQERVLLEHRGVVVPGRLARDEDRRVGGVVELVLERERDHPDEEQDRRRDDDQDREREAEPAQGAGRPGAVGRPHAACRPLRALPRPEQDQRQRDDDDEEDDDHGRGVADVVEGEGLQIEIDVDRLRGGARAALGDDEDRVEGLERVDAAQHDSATMTKGRTSGQVMWRNICHCARAVDQRRLVGLGRQRGEAAQDDQHDERRPLPDLDQHEARDHRPRREHPELRRQADQREQVVQHAELGVEHHRPDQRDRDRRGHHRHHEDGAQEAAQRELAVEHDARPGCRSTTGRMTASDGEVEGVARLPRGSGCRSRASSSSRGPTKDRSPTSGQSWSDM